jgi:hypothetical protein
MKKIAVIIAASYLLITHFCEGTYLGSIVNSWYAGYKVGRGNYFPTGICYGDGYIWINQQSFFTKRIPNTGSVVDAICFSGSGRGDIAFESKTKYLYCACFEEGVYVRHSFSGSTVRTLPLPLGATRPSTIEFDDGAPGKPVWLGDAFTWRLWNLTNSGSFVKSFKIPFGPVFGLAYDRETPGGPFLFAGTRTTPPTIYALVPSTGSIIYSFRAPVSDESLHGLAWDGECLWALEHGNLAGNLGWVFRFVAHRTPAVAPASVGRIKGLYR